MSVPRFDAYGLPVLVAFLGLGSVVLLVGSDQLRQRSIVRDMARVGAAGEIRVAASLSHLWLEEYVSGDLVDIREIDDNLDRALALVRTLLDGQTGIEALADPELRRVAAELQLAIETFRRIASERREGFSDQRAVGIGSALDERYDSVFADLMAGAGRLQLALEERLRLHQARSRQAFLAIVVAWSVLIAAASIGLFRRGRSRLQAETALAASQAQLLEAQKMDAIGRLAGGVVHDINNYLAAIRGHCELLQMKGDRREALPPQKVARKMAAVVRIVHKASALLERLVAVSRRQPSTPRVVVLNRVVAGLEKMLRRFLGERLVLETRLAPDLAGVEIDVSQLEQVLLNLLVNARDAVESSTGGGRIVVTTRHFTGTLAAAADTAIDAWVLLEVADDGPGIAPEVRDKIFEPFFSTKGAGHGGLGLATVYGIVRQHGGVVEVASEPGLGARFRIYLPRSHKPEDPDFPAEDLAPGRGGDERILLVDDNDDFREATRALLETMGYRVWAERDGEAALARLAADAEAELDLLLVDVVLPGISGRELCDQLTRERAIKTLFLSGHGAAEVDRHGIGAAQHLLAKPFSAAQLARGVRRVLDEDSATGDSDG